MNRSTMYVPKDGWRQLVERMHERLEAATAALPAELRDRYRIVDIKEKFGRLRVHLASEGTGEMEAAIAEAEATSAITCDVCGAPGTLAERGPIPWMSVRCAAHENWTRFDGVA